MAKFPINQKKPNMKQSNVTAPTPKKNPPAKKNTISFPTHEGDLGILRVQNPNIPRMVKAPTRTGDALSHHVGKVGSAMKKMGMST